MSPHAPPPGRARAASPGEPALAARLAAELEGEVLFDPWSRGRYATDASIYQIEPIGVVVPRTTADVARAIAICADAKVPVLPRGAGTSQGGQAVGAAVVLDTSKYLTRVLSVDKEAGTATVEPGVVLETLNQRLAPTGLHFPVDISTANRATIGGMVGNNACGARSIRYGNMVHNVRAIDAVLADGATHHFGAVPADLGALDAPPATIELIGRMRALARREGAEIEARFPKLLRRVGGYNIDTIDAGGHNMAHLLVGSEGTLGCATRITLDLAPVPPHRILGVCHFASLHAAMAATKPIVALGPCAVELVDGTMIEMARAQPRFAATVEAFVRGRPEAVLLVEFAGEDAAEPRRGLARLQELMADLGAEGALVRVSEPALQHVIWEMRKAALNILMAMKGDGKPISFVEDCAVALDDLPEYTARLNAIFAKHGTRGTWYAHASVGTLHVRPILNMKDEADVRKMRAIAEECFAMVRAYKGSHSGEHGDGLVRSEFHEAMFGERIVRAFEEVKDAFDPGGLFNPGKIVRASRMDDRALFRYPPGYGAQATTTVLDWSDGPGLGAAVEMCNNNGACRKRDAGVMCPSYRVTGDEVHSTRGRANSLRLALSGQLGAEALTSDEMFATMALCVGCKGCTRECPTGVDMARMKIEFLHHYRRRHGLSWRDRLIAYLPRYAPFAARLAPALGVRDAVPGFARLSERALGFAAARPWPRWRRDRFRGSVGARGAGREVALFADTFSTYFEPDNARAAVRVLEAAGYRVATPAAADGGRPLCCGRTFLAAGLVDEARTEARRTLAALAPYAARGTPIVGLEPACLLTLRDEYTVLLDDTEPVAARALLFEEFLIAEGGAARLRLRPVATKALVHGHCHQKAHGAFAPVTALLARIPDLEIEVIESSCCGMAGAFGYEAEHFEVSMAMAELALLPAVRAADPAALLVADGTSCRQQISDGTGREALHAARVLDMALDTRSPGGTALANAEPSSL